MFVNLRNNNYLFLVAVLLFWFAQYVYIPNQVNFLESISVGSTVNG